MWVVEWQQDDLRHHVVRTSWRKAMDVAWYARFRWGGPVQVMSETTYMGGPHV